ncbi:hypothetical protein EFN04_03520 [Propionibacterium freudenreichii]|nr:hypothetical protein [Propionibacterium freudenreichii]
MEHDEGGNACRTGRYRTRLWCGLRVGASASAGGDDVGERGPVRLDDFDAHRGPEFLGEVVENAREVLAPPRRCERLGQMRLPVDGDAHRAGRGHGDDDVRQYDRHRSRQCGRF